MVKYVDFDNIFWLISFILKLVKIIEMIWSLDTPSLPHLENFQIWPGFGYERLPLPAHYTFSTPAEKALLVLYPYLLFHVLFHLFILYFLTFQNISQTMIGYFSRKLSDASREYYWVTSKYWGWKCPRALNFEEEKNPSCVCL